MKKINLILLAIFYILINIYLQGANRPSLSQIIAPGFGLVDSDGGN